MITLSIRDGHELGKERTDRQLVCNLSFGSVDKLNVVQTNCRNIWKFAFYKCQKNAL